MRRLRTAKGLTLEGLANAVPGYDAGNLSRFERGRQSIDDEKLNIIAAALETPVSEIYREAEGLSSNKNINKKEGGMSAPSKEAMDLAVAIESLPANQRAAMRAFVDSFSVKKPRTRKKAT